MESGGRLPPAAGEAFVVFARSANGNIRVVLSPAPADGETVDVTATAETGAVTRATTRRNGIAIVPQLAPGTHRVDVTAPDYVLVPPQEAAVVGTPDAKWGEAPHAFIVLKPGAQGSADELRAFVREHLAHFKCPHSFTFVTELPKTATGKIQKFVLRGGRSAISTQ